MYDLAAEAQAAYLKASDSTLAKAREAALAAAMAMQDADVAPTAAQVAACVRARALVKSVMARFQSSRE
jgi:hypothetical protein